LTHELGEDLVGVLGPGKRLAALVPAVAEPTDRCHQRIQRSTLPAATGRRGWVGSRGLDLGLLVHTHHHRMRGGIQVQPDHVTDSRLKLRIGGELERLRLPGLDIMLGPDPRDRAVADPQPCTQQPRGPVGHAQHLR
jgi:hypothetical protein